MELLQTKGKKELTDALKNGVRRKGIMRISAKTKKSYANMGR